MCAHRRLVRTKPVIERCGEPFAVVSETLVDIVGALTDDGLEGGEPIVQPARELLGMMAKALVGLADSNAASRSASVPVSCSVW
jgi:hypothetical protein